MFLQGLLVLSAHNYGWLASCFEAAGSSRWHPATLSAGRQKSSFKGAWRERGGAWSLWLVGRLVAKVSELSSQPKWVEGHPTTRLLEEAAEIRCF